MTITVGARLPDATFFVLGPDGVSLTEFGKPHDTSGFFGDPHAVARQAQFPGGRVDLAGRPGRKRIPFIVVGPNGPDGLLKERHKSQEILGAISPDPHRAR